MAHSITRLAPEGGNRRHDLTLTKQISEERAATINAAVKLLAELASGHHVAVVEEIDSLFSRIAELLHSHDFKAAASTTNFRDHGGRILERFRVFLNRAEFDLKRQYGKESGQVQAFKDACAHEYDSSFEYRLAYSLRNESEHKQEVFDVVASASAEREGSTRIIEVRIRDEVLDQSVKDWKASVRKELLVVPRPIRAEPMLNLLRSAVLRIAACNLAARGRDIDEAKAVIHEAIVEAGSEGEPLLVWIDGNGGAGIKMDKLRLEEARLSAVTVDLLR